jgi:hypothetical protein
MDCEVVSGGMQMPQCPGLFQALFGRNIPIQEFYHVILGIRVLIPAPRAEVFEKV